MIKVMRSQESILWEESPTIKMKIFNGLPSWRQKVKKHYTSKHTCRQIDKPTHKQAHRKKDRLAMTCQILKPEQILVLKFVYFFSFPQKMKMATYDVKRN